MRVAIVCPYDLGRPGGVQDQAIRLMGWLRDAGAEPVLVGPGTAGPEGAVLLGAATVVPINRSTAPVKFDPLVGGDVRTALAGFDVVHIHEPLVPMVSIAALRMRLPTVATFHADPPGWVRSAYRIGRIGMQAAFRGVEVTTAVSPVAASAIDGILDYRIIPNGVDVAGYDSGPKTHGRLSFLGRDDERKGLSVLLDAWPQVKASVPQATLRVMGATRTDPMDGVTYLGPVSEEVKREELAHSSIHVAPNLGGESFGLVVLEAMAAGAAVVASKIPAFEFVAGDSARFVSPGNAEEIAEAVIQLLGEPDLVSTMGKAAGQRAVTFDGSAVAAQYFAAYEDALG